MRKFLLFFVFLLFVCTSIFSQKFSPIGKLQGVDFSISSDFMNNGNIFMTSWLLDSYHSYNMLNVYTSDFKFYKSFSKAQSEVFLSNRATSIDHNDEYVTQFFFNDDDLLEFVVDDKTNIIVKNENGETLFSLAKEGTADSYIYLIKIKDKKYFIVGFEGSAQYSVYEVSAKDVSSVRSTTFTKINAFPNPAENEITIEYTPKDSENASVIVTDLNGKVYIVKDIKEDNKLDISSLSQGMYLYQVVANQNTTLGKGKFIVK